MVFIFSKPNLSLYSVMSHCSFTIHGYFSIPIILLSKLVKPIDMFVIPGCSFLFVSSIILLDASIYSSKKSILFIFYYWFIF